MIAIAEESESGDARMKSAYYISQFEGERLKQQESRLLQLMDDEWDSVAVHMMALSKIKSKPAPEKILEKE